MARRFVSKSGLLAVILISMILWISCGEEFSKEDLKITGGIEWTLRVEIDKMIAGHARQAKARIFQQLKEEGISFSAIKLDKSGAIHFLGINKKDERKIKDILVDGFSKWQPQFSGSTILLSLKNSVAKEMTGNAMTQVMSVIKKRLRNYGIKNHLELNPTKVYTLQLRIPPVSDRDKTNILSLFIRRGMLEFRGVVDKPLSSKEDTLQKYGGKLPEGLEIIEKFENGRTEFYVVKDFFVINNNDIKKAKRSTDSYGGHSISLHLNPAGAKKMRKYSAAYIGTKLAIILDGRIKSAPVINDVIVAEMVITGNFTIEEAEDLSFVLNFGAMPAPVKLMHEQVFKPRR